MLPRLLNLLYPSVCELCGCSIPDGQSLCESCCDQFRRLTAPLCQTCGEPFDGALDGQFDCQNCKGLSHDFEFARASLKGLAESFDLVHRLKYQRQFYLARSLATFLQETLDEDERFREYREAHLVPVPLHWRRQQWRHGNQAYELARELHRSSGHPLTHALVRSRSTQTQTKLNRKQRLSNLRGAFQVKSKHLDRLRDCDVILLDDVFTTGATAHECARVLKKVAGVRKVAVLTLVRG
jgi:ComF family protein